MYVHNFPELLNDCGYLAHRFFPFGIFSFFESESCNFPSSRLCILPRFPFMPDAMTIFFFLAFALSVFSFRSLTTIGSTRLDSSSLGSSVESSSIGWSLSVLSFGSLTTIGSLRLDGSSLRLSVESSSIGWSLSVLSFGSLTTIRSLRLDGSSLGFSVESSSIGWSLSTLSFGSLTTIGSSRLDSSRWDSSSLGSSIESSVLSCPSQRSGMTE